MNPLMDFSGLPRFDEVRPEHVDPAVQTLITQASEALERVVQPSFAPRWQDLARELDVATERLGRAWGMVSHLHAVCDTPELRAAYTDALPLVTEFYTRLDRKSTRLNSSHSQQSRMPSSA